jgi:hypothetical protein
MSRILLRSLLAIIVLVNLTGAVLCIDSQCATEMASCSDHHEVEACCTDTGHESDEDHPTDDHCSSCPQCSASVIIIDGLERQHIVTLSLPAKLLIEDTRIGWVSLPERPPSA